MASTGHLGKPISGGPRGFLARRGVPRRLLRAPGTRVRRVWTIPEPSKLVSFVRVEVDRAPQSTSRLVHDPHLTLPVKSYHNTGAHGHPDYRVFVRQNNLAKGRLVVVAHSVVVCSEVPSVHLKKKLEVDKERVIWSAPGVAVKLS